MVLGLLGINENFYVDTNVSEEHNPSFLRPKNGKKQHVSPKRWCPSINPQGVVKRPEWCNLVQSNLVLILMKILLEARERFVFQLPPPPQPSKPPDDKTSPRPLDPVNPRLPPVPFYGEYLIRLLNETAKSERSVKCRPKLWQRLI